MALLLPEWPQLQHKGLWTAHNVWWPLMQEMLQQKTGICGHANWQSRRYCSAHIAEHQKRMASQNKWSKIVMLNFKIAEGLNILWYAMHSCNVVCAHVHKRKYALHTHMHSNKKSTY